MRLFQMRTPQKYVHFLACTKMVLIYHRYFRLLIAQPGTALQLVAIVSWDWYQHLLQAMQTPRLRYLFTFVQLYILLW